MAFNFGRDDEADDWSRKINDIMDEMLKRSFVQFRDSGAWEPATNVYETRDAFHVCIDLAGLDRDDFDVECTEPARVAVFGCRRQPRPEGVGGPLSVVLMEVDEGRFRRVIELPGPFDVDGVEASYAKGFLWIKLPRTTRT